jgi:hypothetical protein
MLEQDDDLPVLPIGIAIGVVVILVVLIALALVCSLIGFVSNPLTAGWLGLMA